MGHTVHTSEASSRARQTASVPSLPGNKLRAKTPVAAASKALGSTNSGYSRLWAQGLQGVEERVSAVAARKGTSAAADPRRKAAPTAADTAPTGPEGSRRGMRGRGGLRAW